MAASQDPNENPVAINVVPMVDVIFCLCVFFMCSFKFKEVEGRFDSWLPKEKGPGRPAPSESIVPELRVALFWDERSQTVQRQVGTRRVRDDAELQRIFAQTRDDCVRIGQRDPPITIDADVGVPWREIVAVMNLGQRESLRRVEFAYGTGR